VFVLSAQQSSKTQHLRDQLAAAMTKEDDAAIRKTVEEMNKALGSKAGVPEVADEYLPIPKDGTWLSAQVADAGFEPAFKLIEQKRWWKIGVDPTKLGHPLREPAAVLSGNLAACRAKLKGADRSLEFATEAGDFLVWAQEQAGTGVFPIPASRGVSQAPPFLASERQLKRAEKEGKLDAYVKNGWAINDDNDGGLQFDNGECGVALLELYEFTKEKKYLASAKKAADWAMSRPVVPNWNYNSFSVSLLARTFRVTSDKKYLEAAKKKTLLGVLPGQLKDGPHAGRWNDAHNARPSYHYLLLRGLVELLAVLPKDDVDRATVLEALKLGLKARNSDFTKLGAPNKDKAMEVLILVHRTFADDPAFLKDTDSDVALDALAKLVSAQAKRGNSPLGPQEWGQFLEYVVSKNRR
jgi:hypothetical protein